MDGGDCIVIVGSSVVVVSVAVVGLGNTAHLRYDSAFNPELGRYSFVNAATAVPIDRYLLSIVVNTTFAEPQRSVRRHSFNLISHARASCISGSIIESSQRLLDIDLVSSADFSDELSAGSSLVSVSRIFASSSEFSRGGTIPPLLFFPSMEAQPSISEYLSIQPSAPLRFLFQLDVSIQSQRQHIFTVTYSLEGGDVFVATTDPVLLAPAASIN